MRTLNLSLALSGAVVALLLLPGVASAQHDHAAHAQVTAPVPPPAKPWDADATLRANMQKIHAVLEQLRRREPRSIDDKLAKDRAVVIEESAAEIFAKCELAPERDAVLHGMLVPLLTATSKFKADPADHASLQAMRDAVRDYPRYFDAPGWTPEASQEH